MEEDKTLEEAICTTNGKYQNRLWSYGLLALATAPVILAIIVYHLDPLDPAKLPLHELTQPVMKVPRENSKVLDGVEFIGVGQLIGPEDIAYDSKSHIIYAACADGWIKRLMVNTSAVENWVYLGGRPLGLALGFDHEIIVAHPFKGLLNISSEGKVQLLTDEVEGRKLKFADGVDIAKDGMIYFSEASNKYGFPEFIFDVLEGKPNGCLMSFNPITNETKVLVRNLYFANGVQLSADQKSVIFCETVMRRCKKYILKGEKQGSLEIFADNLQSVPDNIRYDGEGCYWIAFSTSLTQSWDMALKYPFLRKALAIMERYIGRPFMEKNGGILAIDLKGKPVAHYYDPKLSLISGGNKIGHYLYLGSLHYPYMLRVNLVTNGAT